MIREEGWLRLNQGQDVTRPFNAGLYNKSYNAAMIKNEAAMRTLYTPEELSMFKDFGRVAQWVNGMPPSTQNINPSGSAFTGAKLIAQFGKLGNVAKAWVTKALHPAGGGPTPTGAKAIESFSGRLPPRNAPNASSYAAPAAGLASEPPQLEDLYP
jgi:hypothetical protein